MHKPVLADLSDPCQKGCQARQCAAACKVYSKVQCRSGGCICADMVCCCCRHFKRLRKLPSASRSSELERSAFWSRHSSGLDLQPGLRTGEADQPQAQPVTHASAHIDHCGKGGKHRSHAHHSHRHHHHHRHGRRGSCGWRAEATAVAGRDLDSALSVSHAVHHLPSLSLWLPFIPDLVYTARKKQGRSHNSIPTRWADACL